MSFFWLVPNGRKAKDSGNVMTLRNAEAARIWGNYNAKERRVFHKDYFFALAGVPDLDSPDDSDSPATIPLLTKEEEETYRPLYEKLVDHEKVMREQGVQHLEKNLNKKSLQCVRKVGKMVSALLGSTFIYPFIDFTSLISASWPVMVHV